MFKSLFSKYISAFLIINLFSFAVIVAIITSIINGYSQKTQKQELKMLTLSAREFIASQTDRESNQSFGEFIRENSGQMENMFSALCSNAENSTIIISDDNGMILASFGENADELDKVSLLPADFIKFFEDYNLF